jgi:hypothetical protein
VWVLNGANGAGGAPNWTLVASGGPSRHAQTAVYDQVGNKLILFGGCTGGCLPVNNDVWVLTNANGQGGAAVWTQLATSGSLPAARNHATGAYDPVSNRLIIFGGQNGSGTVVGQTFADVWVLNNANVTSGIHTWSQLSTSGTFPKGQYQARAFYDSANNRLTVAGGARSDTGTASSAVNVLTNANGTGGTPACTNLIAEGAVGAPAFTGWNVDYDPVGNRGILAQQSTANLYYLNNANGLGGPTSYTQVTPAGGAGATPSYGLAFDAQTRRTMTWYQSGSNLSYYLGLSSSSDFAEPVTFTATVSVVAPGSGTPTGMVQFFDGALPIGPPQLLVGGTASLITSSLALGAHNIKAVYNGDLNFNTSSSELLLHTVSQATTTTTVASSSNPSTYADSVTFTSTTLNGVTPVTEGSVTFVEGGTCAAPGTILQGATSLSPSGEVTYVTSALTAGSHTITACYSGTNFASSEGAVTQTVDKAPTTTTVTCGAGPFVYNGAAHEPCTANVTGAGGLNESLTVSYLNNVNAGTATASASYAESANYLGSSDSENFTIDKAPTTTTVTCGAGPFVYNGAAHEPCTASVTGAGGLNEALTVSYLNNVNAGTATASASYAETANYYGSNDSENFTIDKANADCSSITGYGVTYDADPHTATGQCLGVLGETLAGLDLSGTTHTNAGTYNNDPWTFTDVTGNYNDDSGTVNDAIAQRTLNITAVTNTKIYDANVSAAAMPTVSGLQGTDSVTGLAETYDNKHKGTGKTLSVSAYTVNDGNGGNNYDVHLFTNTTGVINAAPLTIAAVTNTKIYDGDDTAAAIPTVTGLQGTDTVTDRAEKYDNRNAGTGKTLSVSAYTINDGNGGANYNVSTPTNTTGVINRRPITVTAVTDTKIYDGNTSSVGIPTVTTGNIVSGDTGNFTQTFDTPLVGTGKTMTPAGSVADGNGGNNYQITFANVATGVITTAYCFNGFFSPIGGSVETLNGGSFVDPVRAFKLGSTIPVKFAILSWNGTTCGAPVVTGIHTLQAIKYSTAVDSEAPIDATPTDAATTGNQFRLTDSQWHFNLSTKGNGFSQGTWLLKATLQDGSIHTVWISIKK